MNINSKAMSAIVDSLFRLVRDGSALHGPFGPRHRGAVGATGKQAVLYAFGSLSRCFGVLCANRSIDLFARCRCTSNKPVVFGAAAAALVKRKMKHIQ